MWLSFVMQICKMIICPGIFFNFKILIFWVVRGLKWQKMAQNDRKFCLSHSVSQEWLWLYCALLSYLQFSYLLWVILFIFCLILFTFNPYIFSLPHIISLSRTCSWRVNHIMNTEQTSRKIFKYIQSYSVDLYVAIFRIHIVNLFTSSYFSNFYLVLS